MTPTKTRSLRLSLAALLMIAAAAAAAGAERRALAQDVPAGDPARGRQIYLADGCGYCHGTVGQGGGGRTGGLRLAQIAMPFAAFVNQLRHPANEMPPYVEAVLSDHDAADVYAFIAVLPPPPDVKSIPLLNP